MKDKKKISDQEILDLQASQDLTETRNEMAFIGAYPLWLHNLHPT